MSQPRGELPHEVEADGYCPFCQTVPCSKRPTSPTPRPPSTAQKQRDRIELKLNKILRHLGLDPDEGSTDATS